MREGESEKMFDLEVIPIERGISSDGQFIGRDLIVSNTEEEVNRYARHIRDVLGVDAQLTKLTSEEMDRLLGQSNRRIFGFDYDRGTATWRPDGKQAAKYPIDPSLN